MNTPLSLTLILAAPLLLPTPGLPGETPYQAGPLPLPMAWTLPQRPNSSMPEMTRIPKSILVSGLVMEGGQTYFTGPNRERVVGPVDIHVTLCGTGPIQAASLLQRRNAILPPISVQSISPLLGSSTAMSAALPGSSEPIRSKTPN